MDQRGRRSVGGELDSDGSDESENTHCGRLEETASVHLDRTANPAVFYEQELKGNLVSIPPCEMHKPKNREAVFCEIR